MENINKNFEQMIWDCHQGLSAEEAIRRTLGDEIAQRSRKLEPMVCDLSEQISLLKRKYAGMDVKMLVFEEIDKRCGEDYTAQFLMISDFKYLISLKNLVMSMEILKAEGQDPEFLRQAIEKAHDAEQQMADDVTAEELEALKQELAAALPDHRDEIRGAIAEAAEDEGWDSLFRQMEDAAEGITEEAKKDVALLAAALYLSQHPDASDETAVAAGIIQASGCDSICEFIFLSLVAVIYVAIYIGVASLLIGALAGIAIFETAGMFLFGFGMTLLGGLALLSVGWIAYELIKSAAPYIRLAWEKCRPYLGRLADKVRYGVACVIGVVANHVFGPVIYWASNTAIPAIDKRTPLALKRRLKKLLAWLGEKKEQVLEFIRQSASPHSGSFPQPQADGEGEVFHEEAVPEYTLA